MLQNYLALEQADVVKTKFLIFDSTGLAYEDNKHSNTFLSKHWQNSDVVPV